MVGDETGGGLGGRLAAPGLFAQPAGAFLDRELGERLLRLELVPLALAEGPGPALPEDGLQVVAGGFVRGPDLERGGSVGHAVTRVKPPLARRDASGSGNHVASPPSRGVWSQPSAVARLAAASRSAAMPSLSAPRRQAIDQA